MENISTTLHKYIWANYIVLIVFTGKKRSTCSISYCMSELPLINKLIFVVMPTSIRLSKPFIAFSGIFLTWDLCYLKEKQNPWFIILSFSASTTALFLSLIFPLTLYIIFSCFRIPQQGYSLEVSRLHYTSSERLPPVSKWSLKSLRCFTYKVPLS